MTLDKRPVIPAETPDDHDYGYKVDLETFSGPLDLLLYLIRQQEVEIADVPIAQITDQYLQHLEVLHTINVNLAGEFLLMAATLMEIKSRLILPRHETEDAEEEEDPRADLIRQLIEYKRFKDAARQLGARAADQARKFARGAAAVLGLPERQPEEDDLPVVLGDVTVWDLLAAFKTILRQTSVDATRHIAVDKKSIAVYCSELLERLAELGMATFRELFEPRASRTAILSTFLALLELIRRRRVRAEQAAEGGEIRILLVDATPLGEDELPEEGPVAAEAAAPLAPEAAPDGAEPSPAEGETEAAAADPRKRGYRRRPTYAPQIPLGDADVIDDEVGRITVPEVELELPPIHLRPPQPPAPASHDAARPRRGEAAPPAAAVPRRGPVPLPRRRRAPACLLARIGRRRPRRSCRAVGIARRRR